LIVSTQIMRHLSSPMPRPQGPILPLSTSAARTANTPHADVIASVRDSGFVIAFLASGCASTHLSAHVYEVLTTREGCDLDGAGSLPEFAARYCRTVEGKRQLVHALAVNRPTADPTAHLTRAAITAWVRAVGLAGQSSAKLAAVGTGLPDWHTPGDM
jgi:hypothetical protein